jgi:capsular exopolysaccharide synthesis family protein
VQDYRSPAEGNLVTLASILPFLYRHAGIIALAIAVALLIGTFYVTATPRGYVATAELLIETKKEPSFWTREGIIDFTIDNAQVESEIEILRSERIANAVINELRLANDPEFVSDANLSDFFKNREAIGAFMNRISAVRIGQSYMVAVSFQSRNADKAARVANAVTQAYLQDHIQAKIDSIKNANAWAQERIADVGAQLNGAARAVQDFKASHGIVDAAGSNQYMYVDTLTELEARVQSYRKLYESFLQGLTQNAQQASFPASAARIISPATTPLGKSYPKTKLVLALSVLMGALAGLGLALLRQTLDRSVRDPTEVRRALHIECFGVLPRQPGFGVSVSRYRAVFEAPLSPFVDALRALKVAINPVGDAGKICVIGVTSLAAGEGKSTIAAGLASIYATAGRRTLLIDGDFRNPSISRNLAQNAETGLLDLLKKPLKRALDAVPVTTGKAGLAVISAGAGEPLANSSDALGSTRMETLLRGLRRSFDVIVIDLPALAEVVDARAAARFLDACILVTEWGRTQLDAMQEPVELLRTCRIPRLGAVINKSGEGSPDFAPAVETVREWIRPRFSFPIQWTGVHYPFEDEHDNEPMPARAAGND